MNAVDVLAATAGVMPPHEIKDARLKTLKTNIIDAIADKATIGIVILGGKLTPLTGRFRSAMEDPFRGDTLTMEMADLTMLIANDLQEKLGQIDSENL